MKAKSLLLILILSIFIFQHQAKASGYVNYVSCINPNPGLGEASEIVLSVWIGGRPADYSLFVKIPFSGRPGAKTIKLLVASRPVLKFHGDVKGLNGIILATRVDPAFGFVLFYYDSNTGKSMIQIDINKKANNAAELMLANTKGINRNFKCKLTAAMPLVKPGS